MQSIENNNLVMPPYLFISSEGIESVTTPLEVNNSLFVGSGSNCGIVLQGDDVDPIHCMFWINEDRVLRIQDWNTGGKTVVNGQSVTAEAILNSGDKVEICRYLIVPVLSQEDHQVISKLLRNSEASTVDAGDDHPTKTQQTTLVNESNAGESGDPVVCETVETAFQVETQHAPIEPDDFATETSCADSAISRDVYDSAADPCMDSGWDEESSNGFGIEQGDFDELLSSGHLQERDDSRDEEVELLRMEVEQLRFELAQREQAESETNREIESGWGSESNPVDDDQTVQLVNRLEDLLEELQSSDERVRGLEELLHFSDQAARAEQEERQQLESWVTEIEQRVSQREAESEAEMSRVLDRLKEAQAQYRHVETQLKQVLQSKGTNLAEKSKELIQKSRDQIHDLQQRLEAANRDNEQLRRQSQCDEGEAKAKEELLLMEQKLLEVQVEASRERAEMARQRAELEGLRDELDQKLNSEKAVGNADSRVEAMRQHLRAIHEEEKNEREEKRQRSLGGRISRLLNRAGR